MLGFRPDKSPANHPQLENSSCCHADDKKNSLKSSQPQLSRATGAQLEFPVSECVIAPADHLPEFPAGFGGEVGFWRFPIALL